MSRRAYRTKVCIADLNADSRAGSREEGSNQEEVLTTRRRDYQWQQEGEAPGDTKSCIEEEV